MASQVQIQGLINKSVTFWRSSNFFPSFNPSQIIRSVKPNLFPTSHIFKSVDKKLLLGLTLKYMVNEKPGRSHKSFIFFLVEGRRLFLKSSLNWSNKLSCPMFQPLTNDKIGWAKSLSGKPHLQVCRQEIVTGAIEYMVNEEAGRSHKSVTSFLVECRLFFLKSSLNWSNKLS